MAAQVNDALRERIMSALNWREGFCTANKSRPNSGKFERCKRTKEGNTRELLGQHISNVLFNNGADAVCALANSLSQTQCAAGHTDTGSIGWFCGQAMPLWLQMRTCYEQATLSLSDPLQCSSASPLQNITDNALKQTVRQMQTFCNMIATLGSSWDSAPTSMSGADIPLLSFPAPGSQHVITGPSTTNASPASTNGSSTTTSPNDSTGSLNNAAGNLDDAASNGTSARHVSEDNPLFAPFHSSTNLEDPPIDWSIIDMTTIGVDVHRSPNHNTPQDVFRSDASHRDPEDFQFDWSIFDMTTLDNHTTWNGFSPVHSTPPDVFRLDGEPDQSASAMPKGPISSPPHLQNNDNNSVPLATLSSSNSLFSHSLQTATARGSPASAAPAQNASPAVHTSSAMASSSALAQNGNGMVSLATPDPPPVATAPPPRPVKVQDWRPRLNRVGGHALSTDKRRRMVEEDEAGDDENGESTVVKQPVFKRQKVVGGGNGNGNDAGAGGLGFRE